MGRGKKNIYYKRINILAKSNFWKEFYNKNPKHKDTEIKKLKELAYDFFDTCGDILVKQPNGLLIDGIGYFANVVFDVKKVMPLRHTTYINLITDGKIYKAYMFPRIYKHRGLYNWSFRIAEKRKGQIAKEIKDGMEYLCHYNIIKKQNNNGRDYFLRGISK